MGAMGFDERVSLGPFVGDTDFTLLPGFLHLSDVLPPTEEVSAARNRAVALASKIAFSRADHETQERRRGTAYGKPPPTEADLAASYHVHAIPEALVRSVMGVAFILTAARCGLAQMAGQRASAGARVDTFTRSLMRHLAAIYFAAFGAVPNVIAPDGDHSTGAARWVRKVVSLAEKNATLAAQSADAGNPNIDGAALIHRLAGNRPKTISEYFQRGWREHKARARKRNTTD